MVLYKGFGHAYFDNTGVYPHVKTVLMKWGNLSANMLPELDWSHPRVAFKAVAEISVA